jgi:hypothetical protein
LLKKLKDKIDSVVMPSLSLEREIIGIDLSHNCLRVVQLNNNKDDWSITRLATQRYEDHHESEAQKDEALVSRLKEIKDQQSFDTYNAAISFLNPLFGSGSHVVVFTLLFAAFCFFVWAFYKSISDKNLFNLNLSQYNNSEHSNKYKFIAVALYFAEYLLITPLLVVVWFLCLSLMVLFLANERSIVQILIISGAIIASIRIFAYTNKGLAEEMAKLFPFVLISTFIISSSALNPGVAALKINSASVMVGDIYYYLHVFVLLFTSIGLEYHVNGEGLLNASRRYFAAAIIPSRA